MALNYPYVKRVQEGRIVKLFKNFPVVVIVGARQVGKSTILEHLFPKIPMVVFDPIIDVEGARSDPDLFLNNRPPPVILDEIQYVPELVPAIKRRLDKNKKPGLYLITGSQQWEVMKSLAESLAGRAVFVDLQGFSLKELNQEGEKGKPWLERWLENPGDSKVLEGKKGECKFSLFEQLWRGWLPETQFLPRDVIGAFHEAYVRTYIERDVRQLAEVSDVQLFHRFFRLCAALTAQEVNYSQLGRDIGINPQTASRWLRILTATFQWFEVPAWSGNIIKRISGKPKSYLTDTGLICFTQAISTQEVLGGHPLWGSIFETAVVNEIKKQASFMDHPPTLYHWHTHGGGEVDLVLERDGKYYPIEVKANTHPQKGDFSGINAFRKSYPHLAIQPGLVIAPAESSYKISGEDYVIPWDSLGV